MSWSARRYKNKLGRNKHHLTPRSRGGSDQDWNLLLIKIERHNELHRIFGNMTLEEIIQLLTRLARMKQRQKAA